MMTFATHLPGKTSGRSNQRRRGAAVVEMALVLPMFLTVVIGLCELTRIIMVKHAMTNAAREGCRTAVLATTQDQDQVESVVREYLAACITQANDENACRITTSPDEINDLDAGVEISVTVEVDYFEISWVSRPIIGDLTLRANSTMRRE